MQLGDVYKIRGGTPYVELVPARRGTIYMVTLADAQKLARAILAVKPDELPFACSKCGEIPDEENSCRCSQTKGETRFCNVLAVLTVRNSQGKR